MSFLGRFQLPDTFATIGVWHNDICISGHVHTLQKLYTVAILKLTWGHNVGNN